jgi:Undecaprenyl-phosphate glucose phosphotransferase
MINPETLGAGDALFAAVPTRTRSDSAPLEPFFVVVLFQAFDLIAPIALGYLCYLVHDVSGPTFWVVCGKFSVVATVLAALIFRLAGCYRVAPLLDAARTNRTLLEGFAWLLFVGFLTAFLSKSLLELSRVWAVLWLGMWAASSFLLRNYATRALTARGAAGQMIQTVAIVGANEWASQVCAQLMTQRNPPVRVVGVFEDREQRIAAPFARSTVGTVEELIALGRRVHIDRVLLALPVHAEARVVELSRRIMSLSVEILACPDLTGFGLLQRPMLSQAGLPLIRIAERPIPGGQFFLKTAFDKIVGGALLVVLGPALLAITLAIKLSSPGPVLFRQKRHGFNNREFEVLKFRTMRTEMSDISGAMQTQRNDRRVTTFGRFLRRTSLDELPQLFNVLLGDMSLVGPRPLPVGMRTQDLSNHEIVEEYAHRHRVRPGITGWAQVNGHRGATDVPGQLQKRVEFDLYYIENWSLAFDMKILVLTALHVIESKNAF